MSDFWVCQRCGRSITVSYVSHKCSASDEAHATLPSVPVQTFAEQIAMARADALEEAARVCNDIAASMDMENQSEALCRSAYEYAASRIRALAKKGGGRG